ncbi:Sec-independent protein translocase protein TatC [Vreelandella aquamarina]|jgi:sec-independent protein translocase protein TatC|uniref:Sec-independent protein translocase protein TatC n=1 Tax=Vreelandella aquamarina TaxID=77097 RepID=A0A0D7UW36_9GAMM|nr:MULTISPECIES: twin-arginine translocase subunit TatC [Halomonas]KTG27286.1 twin-arginine protein translocation system subunit TatC [Idiomarina sp. H105]OAF03362.1 twin-arginine protein translocation system subunit TatC [Idiomarina sp. WRN-38]KJD18233.1 twin-arginine protein translocation system subunit TatC [Halomonas meridiana]MAD21071.1 twin-arginine translocase subunit TatC [Halomonas sp.]MDK2750027.1 twin-arginine translocase subunit TatC [Halomonas meridiana]|tara:strand:+ start:231 stop:1013 length:783 start_codon:yes stop_codon:yes gene_type:complete
MSMSGDSPEPHNDQSQAPLIEHLIELRSRLMKAIVVILVVFLGLYSFANDIYSFVAEPLMALLPEGSQMIATEVASPFLAPFKLTLVVAVFIAIPFVLHQAWAFVAPGLYDNEKMLAIPILVSSVALFYAGAAFAYYVVFPLLFEFFTQTGPENVAVMTDINQYLNFVLKLFFAFGVAFEIPIATFLLILSGATTVESLSKKRPYIVLGCFVVGMLLTPPDVISQSLLAIPMYLLYEVGLLFGRLVRKRRAEADAEDQES